MTEKIIILGTAHGKNVGGKRSPDGKFREYQYSRSIVGQIKTRLEAKGLRVFVDMMEGEVPLPQTAELKARVKFVNDLCDEYGAGNCLYVSVHVDAAGSDSKWMKAGGWTAYTSRGQTRADRLATHLYEAAQKHLAQYAAAMEDCKKTGKYDSRQEPFRTDYSDGDADKEAGFYVLTKTKCPAVLTENLFMDNKSDVAFLNSEGGVKAIVGLHVDGILAFLDEK